jgi:hypothetical protein
MVYRGWMSGCVKITTHETPLQHPNSIPQMNDATIKTRTGRGVDHFDDESSIVLNCGGIISS